MKTATAPCPGCGALVAPTALRGLCPRCTVHCSLLADLRSPAAPANAPSGLGDYELLQEIARGGMGVVYRARQISLNRMVAIKMVLFGRFAEPRSLERFRAEAEAAAGLRHPHIVPIHEVGEHDGQPWYSMDFIEGPSLDDEIQNTPPPSFPLPRNRIQKLFAGLCDAVHFAHQHGVIHRDIKPGNVLIDSAGRPHLTDFGIAQRLESDAGLTLTGQTLGSPHYMPPEQASGLRARISVASDVYSLGAILYHVIAGRPPFAGETLPNLLRAVLEAPPVRPRLLQPSIDPDLETICLKCLEKEPGRRYATAKALAEDLELWHSGQPISARPVGPFERAWLWARRNRSIAALAASLGSALAIGFVAVLWQSSGRKQALIEARRTLYTAQIQAIQHAWDHGDTFRAKTLLLDQIPRHGEEDLRGFEWRYFWKLCRDHSAFGLTNDQASAWTSVAVSPDGQTLASGDLHGNVQMRRTSDWEILRTVPGFRGGVWCLTFSPDGKRLAVAGADKCVALLEVVSGHTLGTCAIVGRLGWYTTSLRFAPDASVIAFSGPIGKGVYLWKPDSGQDVPTLVPAPSEVRHAAFDPTGHHLALVSQDSSLRIWEAASFNQVHRLQGPSSVVTIFEYSPDGRTLASADANGTIHLWSTDSWQELRRFQGHLNLVTTLAFTTDGGRLVSGGRDASIRVWDVSTGSAVATLRGHDGWIGTLAVFPDGHRVASTGDDGTVRIWDLPPTDLHRQPTFETESILNDGDAQRMGFSPDGRILATLGTDAPARRLWDSQSGSLIAAMPGGNDLGAFSSDSSRFAAGHDDGTVGAWDTTDGHEIARFRAGDQPIKTVAWSPDGTLLAAAGKEEIVRRWDLKSGLALPPWEGFSGGVIEMQTPPAADFVAVLGRDGNIRLRGTANAPSRPSIPFATDFPLMRLSPDGTYLAITGGVPGAIDLWETRTGQRILQFGGKSVVRFAPAFSPDGRRIAVSGSQARIEIWELRTRELTARFDWMGGRTGSASFSSDGQTLAVSDNTGTVRLWNLKMMREVMTLSVPGNFGGVDFSPDGTILAIHNIFRNNRLLRAVSLAEMTSVRPEDFDRQAHPPRVVPRR